ncbi:microtubule-associated serine/threonine-protein kinase 3 isoform X2 [Myzus persicae]|uniref:microtubule-associated serine/threonine-protein kinase 3 isoform X2 n=1 Tax=Myzus persicae TaxID=13164 RepID=UPI000B9390BF|nr:microtubule-associated serine/threonine-protein kinase 3 isoform X2 [Myzus persicae]
MDSRRSWKGQLSLKESEHRRYSDSEEHKSKTSVSNNSELSNLVLMRNSTLGQSAPSLSNSLRELHVAGSGRRSNKASHRKSFISNTSPTLPRCHSPMSSSPLESPKVVHSHPHFPFVSIKRPYNLLTTDCRDGRRWSVASLPSSGYGTTSGSSNVSSQCSSQERLHQLPNMPTSDELHMFSKHFSSNDSTHSAEEDNIIYRKPRFNRPRSRSLSPSRSPVIDNDIVMMNVLYKDRFPKATHQMEERLSMFINEYEKLNLEHIEISADAVPIVRFVNHQVLEIARDCLKKSEEKLITRGYFYEMSENLELLLAEAREKSEEATALLTRTMKKLLLIISRPARLLECLEFDPEEFYHLLEQAEGQAKICQGIKDEIPQYIIGKLGLNRNSVDDIDVNFHKLDEYSSSLMKKTQQQSTKKDTFSSAPSEVDFDVIKLISNGAYGAVYLVRHKQTRQRFAMKKIIKNNLMLRNQIEQVFAERDIMSFTDNPFVVTMYCSFETRKHLCLVMEYVEGGDCASLLKNIGPLPPDMAKFYFAETVLAVEYLHNYGIVHRDLKPDNLLITALGHIKLTDFGLSKMGLMSLATNLYEVHVDRDTRQFSDKQVFGTPEYIAPEVILRQGYGKPVDWWSMGIILYEFLVGCVPFFGETPEELFAHTVNDDIEWPDENEWPIQPEAKNIISSLLQQNPRDRLGTGGSHEVKDHPYFYGVDWNSLLRQKAEFMPQLGNEEDTSYFDSRSDRYSHEIDEDTDDDSLILGTFSSCSPQFKKVASKLSMSNEYSSLSPSVNYKDDSLSINTGMFDTSASEGETVDESLKSPVAKKTTIDKSQNEDNESNTQISRRRRLYSKESIPKFSISIEDDRSPQLRSLSENESDDPSSEKQEEFLSLPVTANLCPTLPPSPSTSSMSKNHKSNTLGGQRARSVIKSFSATGLSLMIPPESSNNGLQMKSPGSCSALNSPCRDVPLITSLKPPIILRRGPSGFGFTVNTIRVYFGDSDFYTMHHLVMAVDSGSPAFEAGLSPGDLITHVNGEQVQGMNHTQVLQLLLSGGDKATLRSTPLEFTTIKTGGRRREPGQSKLASNARHRGLGFAHHSHRHKRSQRKDIPAGESRRRQKSSLFRRISTKCTPDYQQLTIMGNRSPAGVVAQDSVAAAAVAVSSTSADYSSSTSSSSSSANSSPTVTPNSPTPYQRPSTLHGLKHKLHSATKNLHSPNRRKSVGHIPLSPLARTPSPSPLPQSPTRSPSPLTFSSGHQPGSSNTTQSYSPSSLTSSNPAAGAGGVTASGCGAAAGVGGSGGPSGCCISTGAVVVVKKTAGSSFGRPCKTSEPGSPLLRRALSPDRLHPRTAETKSNSISPLCDPALKVTTHHAPRVTVTTKSPPMCARGPGAAAANLPLSKTCTTTTTTTTATKILQNNSAASTPNAEEKAVVVPAASKNEQPPSSQVNKLFSADVGSGAAGHVSLPRIAEERDHLQQNQLHHHHHHNHQLMQPTVAAAAVVDRPKPAKSANGGCRYFFNRKYKQQREQQQQQQPQPQTPPPCCKPDEACKNGATGKHGAANDTSPPATSSTHQP